MKLSLLLGAAAVASAASVPRGSDGPNGGYGPKGGNMTGTTPALFEGETGCTYPIPDPKFKLEKYLGEWYQVAGTTFRETNGSRCVTAEYTKNDNGTVRVENTSILGDSGEINSVVGTATPVDPKRYGKGGAFIVEFPEGSPNPCPGPNYIVQKFGGDYSIVQTSNWATLFILARERNPPEQQVQCWIDEAVQLGTNATEIIKFNQSNCE